MADRWKRQRELRAMSREDLEAEVAALEKTTQWAIWIAGTAFLVNLLSLMFRWWPQ